MLKFKRKFRRLKVKDRTELHLTQSLVKGTQDWRRYSLDSSSKDCEPLAGYSEHGNEPCASINWREISWQFEGMLASQEGLFSVARWQKSWFVLSWHTMYWCSVLWQFCRRLYRIADFMLSASDRPSAAMLISYALSVWSGLTRYRLTYKMKLWCIYQDNGLLSTCHLPWHFQRFRLCL